MITGSMHKMGDHVMRVREIMRCVVWSLAIQAAAIAGDLPHKWHSEPVTSTRMEGRIAQAAQYAKQEGRVPFAVLYDIAYPQSAEEYGQLGHCAVLYLAALTQGKDNLPIKRAYIVEDGTVVVLQMLKEVLSEQADRGSLSAQVFGPYRSDALYLLPIALRLKPTELFVEFAKQSSISRVAKFGTPLSPQVKDILAKDTGVSKFDERFLYSFIRREYPGFGE